MAQWQVVASKIELFPHPDPKTESLLLGKVGPFQVVVAKSNNYVDGQVVVFAPERSVLPEEMRHFYVNTETGISYLTGAQCDRVRAIKLRGALSEGVTIPLEYAKSKFPNGEVPLDTDISEVLGITKYEPSIPTSLLGICSNIDEPLPYFCRHDVEQFGIYQNQLIPGEEVIATEKIHGTQINIYRTAAGTVYITSKGLAGKQITILESESNAYWKAVHNSGILARLRSNITGNVQVFGEVIPIQVNFSYGSMQPTIRVFRIVIDGVYHTFDDIKCEEARSFWKSLWVPIVYRGPFELEKLVPLAQQRERVSGKQLHIAEGIVVQPYPIRDAKEGFPLLLKIINPKFKSSDEDIS